MNAWLALVITDVVAVSTFARCFSGPGELTAALVTLVAVHLAGLAARGGPSGIRAAARRGVTAGSARRTAGKVPLATRFKARWWVLAVVAAAVVPLVIVVGFGWLIPGDATWHVLSRDLVAAWRAFSYQLAPVPELPGLVLATAWAAGGVALLAELTSAWRKAPAAFARACARDLSLRRSARDRQLAPARAGHDRRHRQLVPGGGRS